MLAYLEPLCFAYMTRSGAIMLAYDRPGATMLAYMRSGATMLAYIIRPGSIMPAYMTDLGL